MIRKTKTMGIHLAAAGLASLLLQGCGLDRMITIDSEPQGAVVKADGKQVGTTPLQVNPDQVFPPRWYGTTYKVMGKLDLERDGCEGYSQEVNDLVLSKDIKATLRCAPGVKAVPKAASQTPAAVMPAPMPSATAPMPAPAAAAVNGGIEQRLQQLKTLHDKGLITDQDYNEQRQRILSEL